MVPEMAKRDPPLRLDDRFTHVVVAGETLVLVGDDDTFLLEGVPARDVLGRVDGRSTAVEIARALEERHRPEIVHYVLLRLERAGVLREVGSEHADAGPTEAPGPTTELAHRLRNAWEARGTSPFVRIPPTDAGVDPELVLTDDYLHAGLAEMASSEDGRPLLLTCLGSRRVWIGPRVLPGVTACVSCLQERLRMNLAARGLVHARGVDVGEAFEVRRMPSEVPEAAFQRLARVLSEPGSVGSPHDLLRVEPLGEGEPSAAHRVFRLPHCPACGEPGLAPPGPAVRLRPRPRAGRSGGGYRTIGAEATLARFSPLISPLTGVVRRVQKVPVEGCDLVHVYTASHASHHGVANLRAVKDDRRDHSGGKGMTDVDARTSALCEALERFSAVHRGTEPVRLARLSELGGSALHPNALMHFSRAQLEGREEWNARQAGGFQRVPDPYEDEPIAWSPARSLVSGEVRWLPSAHLYHGYKGEGSRFCRGDSNGLAGGNCVEEAVLQGFLELVERDAVALWWYNRARLAGVDLASAADPRVGRILGFYNGLDRTVWALDLTTDLGIPCFAALSAKEGAEREDLVFGFGAHLDPHIALARALTELNQMLPTVLRTPEERRRHLLPEFEDAIRWWDSATREGHPYLLASSSDARSLEGFDAPDHQDLRDAVLDCVSRAAAAGCDVLVHDLTRPDVGLAVVRVVVPGLRHFWRRLGPGRLYDVPPRVGWVATAPSEAEMNPVSMFV